MPDKNINNYFLKIKSNKLNIMAGINGAWLVRDTCGKGMMTMIPLTSWIKPTTNTVNLFYFQEPVTALEKGFPSVSLQIFKADPDSKDVVEPLEVYVNYNWERKDYNLVSPQTIIKPIPFDKNNDKFTSLLDNAEDVTSLNFNRDDKDFNHKEFYQILELTQSFQKKLIEKKFSEIYRLQEFKFKEEAYLNYKNISDHKAKVMNQYKEMADSKLEEWKPINKNNLSIRKIFNNRILEVNRNVYDYPVSIAIDETYLFEVPIYLAKISQKWVIVR